jgi:flavin reductase (DIM6/NTAB) family NADH-FMN oxidoreductase RutF
MLDKKLSAGLHLIANGVFVVAAEHRGLLRGFTATWVSQISYQHPILLISVAKTHDTYPLINGSNKFYVNVLGASQADLARHFGRSKSSDETDTQYFREEHGVSIPVLNDSVAYLECRVISTHDVKDQTLFIGEVVNTQVFREENPLIFWRSRGYAKSEPFVAKPSGTSA